ncbi:MAG: cytochrome C [Ramlibacter sp.]
MFALAACLASAAPVFEDTMAQRTLACAACHGKEGRAEPDGYYPRIAGKPAGYLYNQLLNFRDGRRHYGLMTRLLDPLSDAYLLAIAQYFASLDLPYPPARRSKESSAVMERGQALALRGDEARRIPACVQCHGAALTGVAPATPGLLGLPRDYLNAQLGAWKAGQRHAQAPDCMARIARDLAPGDLTAVASWLAAQTPPADGKPAATLPQSPPIACGSAALPAEVKRP